MLTQLIIKKVSRSFGDDNSIFIKSDDIIDWINDAQLQIVRETNCLIEEAIVPANTTPWALPANFLKTARVLYGNRALQFIAVEALDSQIMDITITTVQPMYFYFIKSELRLYPGPQTSDTTSVTIQYTKVPVYITDSADELTVPSVYHEDVVRFCLARAHERNENYRGMEIAMAEFNNRISSRIDETEKQDEAYTVIRDDPFWMGRL